MKEVVEPEYKLNDKLSAQEAQLETDMQKEKEEEKELTTMHLKHKKAKHNHHPHHHHHHHHKRRHRHHHRHHGVATDETEEGIEKEEKVDIEFSIRKTLYGR